MTHAGKKTTIFILIAIFVVTMCFSILAFSKNLYADTGYGEGYSELWERGTDTGSGDPGYYEDEGIEEFSNADYWGSVTWYYEQTVFEGNYYESYSEDSWWWYQTGVSPADSYYYEWDDTWDDSGTYNGYDYVIITAHSVGWERFDVPVPTEAKAKVRTHEMVCAQINIIEKSSSVFELIFFYEYANNNWIRIYDMEGNLVFQVDFPYGSPTVIVDLPDGMYNVEVFHEEGKILQEFVIGKS